ncbi:hypothetical protein M3Y99_00122100 [Aphelenchoides fujianensis]|nr:hypothetical protein M3Y99_00122100 [Aphelenchoides fujianensis]
MSKTTYEPLSQKSIRGPSLGTSLFRFFWSLPGRVVLALLLVVLFYSLLDKRPTEKRPADEVRQADPPKQPKQTKAVNGTTPVPPECLCGTENFCFKGLDEKGGVQWGRRFDCRLLPQLQAAGLTDADAARAPLAAKQAGANESAWTPVFVTSVSSNHFREARAFEAFQEHKTFFYFDSSIRINGSNLHEFLRAVRAGELPPHQTVPKTIHSVWATTDPGMRVFLPLPLIVAQMWEIQSPAFVSDAPYTRHVLKWWLLCAWTRECIDPPGAVVKCRPKEFFDLRRTWIGCHRYDQAGISPPPAFWNLVALAHLFGEERGALALNYTTKPWAELSENLVAEVESKRLSSLGKFSRLIKVSRGDGVDKPLQVKCT